MEDPNEREWRIQEFRPPDKNAGRLRQIWNTGLNLGKMIALTGIVVSAAPLALPPLVVLSAFGVAFIVPFGFYFASYAATDKIMSALLTMPNQPQPPLLIQSGDVFGDEIEKAYEYSDDKVEEEGYDLEEKEKELEDDTTLACTVRSGLDEENNEIRDGSEFSVDTSSQLGIDEDVKDIGDVIADKFEQDGYEEEDGEYMEKEEPVPRIASEILKEIREVEEISSMEEGRGEMLGIGVEVGVVSVEVVGENDIDVDQVEVVHVFGPQVSMEDSRSMVKFGDVELEELEKNTDGMSESIRDEGVSETKRSVEKEEPSLSIASEILKGIREAEEEMSLVEEGSEEEMHGNGVKAVVVSAEVGGENVIDVEQVDVIVPRVSMEDSSRKVKFGDVEPEELEGETTGMIESIREEGLSETKNHEHSMEKAEPIPSRASEIPKGFREAGEELPLVEEGMGETVGNGVEAVVVSSEAGGENHIDAEQVDLFGPRVRMEDSSRKVKFGDVEPVELERETDGMIESLRNEGTSEDKNHEHSREMADESIRDIADDLEKLMVPSEKGSVDTIAVLQEHSIIVSTSRDDVAVSPKEEIQDTKHSAMFVIPGEGTGSTMGLLGEEGVAYTDPVCVRKLVVHVNRSGDSKATTSIGGATAPNTTLILRRADTRGTAAASLLGQDNEVQDRRPRSAINHPEGIYLNSGDIQDASLHDQDLPTKPIEGLNNEVSIWKQINAMRTLVGYEAQPHVSCVEELKALYVFTGVEPPASFNEPLSIADVYEKLLLLMAVVGVKE